jgi:hypothetical protein
LSFFSRLKLWLLAESPTGSPCKSKTRDFFQEQTLGARNTYSVESERPPGSPKSHQSRCRTPQCSLINCCLPLWTQTKHNPKHNPQTRCRRRLSASPHLVNPPSHRSCTCIFCRARIQLIFRSQSCQLHRPQRSIYPGPEQSEPFADPFGEHHNHPFFLQRYLSNSLSEDLDYRLTKRNLPQKVNSIPSGTARGA